jgi:MYXO-CTERM domain-containing protein
MTSQRFASSRRVLGSSFAMVAIAACSSAPPSDLTASTSSEIIHGTTSDASQDSVVLIEQLNGASSGACSGVLLASNLVMTARHCVSNLTSAAYSCDANGNGSGQLGSDLVPGLLFVYTGSTRPPGWGSPAPARGKKIIHDGSNILCNHDLALIVLDTDIPNAQIASIRLDSPPTMTDTVRAVGWGMTDTMIEPPQRMQRTGIPIRAVGPATTMPLATPPSYVMVGEAFCEGDSGGPGFAESTGAVIGIVSAGNNGAPKPSNAPPWYACLDEPGYPANNLYSRVDAFKDVILSAYMEAGHDPWLEGQPDPRLAKFNDACGANTDCQSNLCLVDPKSQQGTCTQDCSMSACPATYDCVSNKDLGAKVCEPHVNPPAPTKSGCSASPSSGGAGVWAIAAIGLALARRRRAR